jgi:hypothetical protein
MSGLFVYGEHAFNYNCVMTEPKRFAMDKTALSVASLSDEPDEKAYWRSKTPHERLAAVEEMRQIIYGYDPSTSRLQRLLEVVELQKS